MDGCSGPAAAGAPVRRRAAADRGPDGPRGSGTSADDAPRRRRRGAATWSRRLRSDERLAPSCSGSRRRERRAATPAGRRGGQRRDERLALGPDRRRRAGSYPTTAERPNLVTAGGSSPIFPTANGGTRFRLAAGAGAATAGDDAAIPVVASDAFLAQSGVSVGDEVRISSAGRTFAVRLIGSTPGIAPLDPGKPVLFGDLATVDLARYGATGNVQQADEWWMRTDPGAEPAVLAALRGAGMDTSRVVGRDELTASLSTDPVPLGLIGILALGSLSAMIFATIGFLVTATVSANERLGEFALLRALGLSTRQLSWWLSIESLFLLDRRARRRGHPRRRARLARAAVHDPDPDGRGARAGARRRDAAGHPAARLRRDRPAVRPRPAPGPAPAAGGPDQRRAPGAGELSDQRPRRPPPPPRRPDPGDRAGAARARHGDGRRADAADPRAGRGRRAPRRDRRRRPGPARHHAVRGGGDPGRSRRSAQGGPGGRRPARRADPGLDRGARRVAVHRRRQRPVPGARGDERPDLRPVPDPAGRRDADPLRRGRRAEGRDGPGRPAGGAAPVHEPRRRHVGPARDGPGHRGRDLQRVGEDPRRDARLDLVPVARRARLARRPVDRRRPDARRRHLRRRRRAGSVLVERPDDQPRRHPDPRWRHAAPRHRRAAAGRDVWRGRRREQRPERAGALRMAPFRRPGPAVGCEPAGDDPGRPAAGDRRIPRRRPEPGSSTGVAMRSGLLGLLVAHAGALVRRRRRS